MTVGDALRLRAQQDGGRDFVVSPEHRLTYAEMESASAALARRMICMGIGKGTRVGLQFSYSVDWIVCWLAACRIGALTMPLSTVYTPRELSGSVRFGDVQVLFTAGTVAGKDNTVRLSRAFPSLAGHSQSELRLAEAPFLRRICLTDGTARPWATSVSPLTGGTTIDTETDVLGEIEREVLPSDLAVTVYTSGSSAKPKGVVHTHESILRSSAAVPPLMRKRARGLPPKVLCGMPFFWVGGILTVGSALLDPITLLLVEDLDPEIALSLMERERGTYVQAWPTLIHRLRAHPSFAKRDLASAPEFVSGAADVSLVNTPEPGVPMHRGMTETMGTFAGVETKIVDPATGDEVAPGKDGELLVRGVGVMDGYYKRARNEVFDQNGWYHTGDRCFRLEGDSRTFYRGRENEMIKCAGANVSPREVELVIEELPSVEHCFVFGVPDRQRGEAVVAVIVPSAGATSEQEVINAHARASLSGYKIPTRWLTVDVADVVWLGSGKPDKRSLRELVEARLPSDEPT